MGFPPQCINATTLTGACAVAGCSNGSAPVGAVEVVLGTTNLTAAATVACASSTVHHAGTSHWTRVSIVASDIGAAAHVRSLLQCCVTLPACGRWSIGLHVLNLAPYPLLEAYGRTHAASVTNFMRFYLPALLPMSDRAMWIDSDAIVLGDVARLLPRLFRNRHAEAALAQVPRRARRAANISARPVGAWTADELVQLGAAPADGAAAPDVPFNAGVLALNLRAWRRRRITSLLEDVARRLTARRPSSGAAGCQQFHTAVRLCGHSSQTPLNLVFADPSTTQELPAGWNYEALGSPFSRRNAAMFVHKKYASAVWRRSGGGQFRTKGFALPIPASAQVLHWNGKHKPWCRGVTPYNRIRRCRQARQTLPMCGEINLYAPDVLWRQFAPKRSGRVEIRVCYL